MVPGRYPESPRSQVWRNANGRFETAAEWLAPELSRSGMVTGAVATDVDLDGWIDLVVTMDWGRVHWWRNREGKGFSDESHAMGLDEMGSGWWRLIEAADINSDGRTDFLLGNVGLNTVYRATETAPAVLYAGDVGARSRDTLIEAMTLEGQEFPRVSRGRMSAVISEVGRKYRKFDDYAEATLPELWEETTLRKADRHEVTELCSGVLLSGADGRWRFRALPTEAQFGPIAPWRSPTMIAMGTWIYW